MDDSGIFGALDNQIYLIEEYVLLDVSFLFIVNVLHKTKQFGWGKCIMWYLFVDGYNLLNTTAGYFWSDIDWKLTLFLTRFFLCKQCTRGRGIPIQAPIVPTTPVQYKIHWSYSSV